MNRILKNSRTLWKYQIYKLWGRRRIPKDIGTLPTPNTVKFVPAHFHIHTLRILVSLVPTSPISLPTSPAPAPHLQIPTPRGLVLVLFGVSGVSSGPSECWVWNGPPVDTKPSPRSEPVRGCQEGPPAEDPEPAHSCCEFRAPMSTSCLEVGISQPLSPSCDPSTFGPLFHNGP